MFERVSRRELLKLSPALGVGAFLIPRLRDPLLRTGVNLSDRVAYDSFRIRHLAPTFADSQVAPLEKFPFNSYNVLDPELDLASWSLSVEGLVKNPGQYRMAEIRSLPRVVQNTLHLCVSKAGL